MRSDRYLRAGSDVYDADDGETQGDSRNRGVPLHHRKFQHSGKTLLPGQRTPDENHFRRNSAYPGHFDHPDLHFAQRGFPTPGEHRFHPGCGALYKERE